MRAVVRVRDGAKATSDAAVAAELASGSVQGYLRDVASRVAAAQVHQWVSMAQHIGIHLTPAHTDGARKKFLDAAEAAATTAYRSSKAAAAVRAAVASLPHSVIDAVGGPVGVDAVLEGGSAQAHIVETFTVTLPLHSMSPDFLIPDDKYARGVCVGVVVCL